MLKHCKSLVIWVLVIWTQSLFLTSDTKVAAQAFDANATSANDRITVIKDVFYRENQTELDDYQQERCFLDWYLPASKTDFPTIVWFHGGGLRAGQKDGEHDEAIAKRFAEHGIAVASVNYRLNPRAKFPSYIEDSAAAVAFVVRSVKARGGNPKRVFVSGHSAGGYLTLMLALDPKYLGEFKIAPDQLAGYLPISGQTITHSTVRAEKGIDENQPWIDQAAPAYFVANTSAPILCIAGSKDLPGRAEENRYLVAMLTSAKHDATYFEVEGRDHSTIAHQIPNPDDVVAKRMFEFIAKAIEN